jgi:hypothetical protein
MKITALYAALAVVGMTAVALVPLTMYRSGSPALPAWRAAVSPGPLSAAHAFLRTQCGWAQSATNHSPRLGAS